MSETSSHPRPDVELRLPADSAYAAVLRTTAAGLAARLDFTIDDIEDLRIAVGEAHALALEWADEGAHLEAGFLLRPGAMYPHDPGSLDRRPPRSIATASAGRC